MRRREKVRRAAAAASSNATAARKCIAPSPRGLAFSATTVPQTGRTSPQPRPRPPHPVPQEHWFSPSPAPRQPRPALARRPCVAPALARVCRAVSERCGIVSCGRGRTGLESLTCAGLWVCQVSLCSHASVCAGWSAVACKRAECAACRRPLDFTKFRGVSRSFACPPPRGQRCSGAYHSLGATGGCWRLFRASATV